MKILLSLFLISSAAYAAFDAKTRWDVRTTGSAVNGGGFAPGLGVKDVTAATDLTVDATLNNKVTSASHNFVSGDINKFLCTTAGTFWNVQCLQILSVASNAALLDQSPTYAGNANTATYDLYSAIDYSQQDAAQISFTDMVIGGTSTQFTSVLNPITDAMVGNAINVASGATCTVQTVQIISQSAGTATVDKSLGTAAGVCSGALGGSRLTVASITALYVAGNSIHIKGGTYTLTTTTAFAVTCTTAASCLVEGFATNHFDAGTPPLVTTATNSTTLWSLATTSFTSIKNIKFTNTASTRGACLTAITGIPVNLKILNSIFDGCTRALSSTTSPDPFTFARNAVLNTTDTTASITAAGSNQWIVGNVFYNNAGYAIDDAASTTTYQFLGNMVAKGKGMIQDSGTTRTVLVVANGNTCVDASVDCIRSTESSGSFTLQMQDNLFDTVAGKAVNITADTTAPQRAMLNGYNVYYAITGANVNWPSVGFNDKFLSVDPLTSHSGSNTDWSVNNTAGGGAVIRGAGWPGSWTGITAVGNVTPGALQVAAGAGGASPVAYGIAQ